ncbi:protein-tyrosine phosphatase family protein [Ferruginibacter sp.]
MNTKIYWIHQFENNARLGIMARPRGNDWLEDEINNLENHQVGVLVSLLESEEIYELGLEKEIHLCRQKGINCINFPVKDRGVPDSNEKVHALINLLAAKLNEGHSVVVHCRMGIGRSSIIAGAILLRYQSSVNNIIDNIIRVRGLNVPDTDEQLQWLKRQ